MLLFWARRWEQTREYICMCLWNGVNFSLSEPWVFGRNDTYLCIGSWENDTFGTIWYYKRCSLVSSLFGANWYSILPLQENWIEERILNISTNLEAIWSLKSSATNTNSIKLSIRRLEHYQENSKKVDSFNSGGDLKKKRKKNDSSFDPECRSRVRSTPMMGPFTVRGNFSHRQGENLSLMYIFFLGNLTASSYT